MIISRIDSQYIREHVIPRVDFANTGKPCKLFDCVQVESVDTVRAMWPEKFCAQMFRNLQKKKDATYAQCMREIENLKPLLHNAFSRNPVVREIVGNSGINFDNMMLPLIGASLEWIKYGDNSDYVWFRSMIPVLLSGHLVCGYAGPRTKVGTGYRMEAIYYVY